MFYLEDNCLKFLRNLASGSIEKLYHYISPLSAESMDAFHQSWKIWTVKKDHFLLKENTVSDYIYFIENGVARIYYYKNGKEITEWIALEPVLSFDH